MAEAATTAAERKEETLPSWLSEENDGKQGKAATEDTPLLKPPNDKKKTDKPKVVKGSSDKGTSGRKPDSAPEAPKSTNDRKRLIDKDSDFCTTACVDFFIFVSTVAIFSCLALLTSQVLPLFFVEVNTLQLCLRIYISVFCIIFVLAELEWTPWIRNNKTLSNWISRGFVYSFVGLIGMEESIAVRVEAEFSQWSNAASLFITISAWCMTVIGAVYFCLGILCMKQLRDKVRARRDEQREKAKERLELLREEGLA